jgi:hypothetical protein
MVKQLIHELWKANYIHRDDDYLGCQVCNYIANTDKVRFGHYIDLNAQDTNMKAHINTYKHYINKEQYEEEIAREQKNDEHENAQKKMYNELIKMKS